jgi:FKBP-type peptidyl-prolyl cis-trans isomerase FklB
MNLKNLLSCLLIVLVVFSCTTTKKTATVDTTAAAPKKLLNNELDSISYAMGINIAKNIKSQGLDSVNTNAFAEGVMQVMNDDSLLLDVDKSQSMLSDYFQKLYNAKLEANATAGKKFLDENKSKEGVKTTPSGLQYIVVKEGTGAKPKVSDRVKVHYHGTLIDGTVFDSSIDRGEPIAFAINGVIPGWTEALQLMSVGAKYKLFIPSDLAYGERGAPPVIGPNSALIFDVELLEIEK